MPKATRLPFTPNPELMALRPGVSGNDVNGLGEEAFRRPSVVYWAENPDDIPHGAMQKWFYSVDTGMPEYGVVRKRRADILAAPLVDLAPERAQITPEAFAAFGDAAIAEGIFDKIGVTRFNPNWAFEGFEIRFRNVIILGFQHDYEELETAPEPRAGLEVLTQYTRAAAAAKHVANWLRQNGWDAEALTGPMKGKITMIPAAIEAGFGELGKHGSLITPEFGSSFRLSAILTDCDLPLSAPVEYGIDEFCSRCRVCSDACPPDAIFQEKQTVRGVKKWYVDFDKCLPFFNEHQGCALCLAVCPWSRPGVGLNLAAKLKARAERLSGEAAE
jgi:epoxyqueuosine reductase